MNCVIKSSNWLRLIGTNESATKTSKKLSKTGKKKSPKPDNLNMKWRSFKKNMPKIPKRSFYYSKNFRRHNFIKKPSRNRRKSYKNLKSLSSKPSKILKKQGKSRLKWSSFAVKIFSSRCRLSLTKEK